MLTDRFIETFEAWGYGFMVTPLIEPLDTIAAGVGGAQQTDLFRFMDSDGSLLALVGERTVSVARVVATQLHDGPFPLRLCYAGSVLRNQTLNAGRRRESLQAGCELIGASGLAADAECIALAAAALERGGVEHIQVDVGHADFIPGLLESAGLDAPARDEVLAALARRDLVAVELALEGTDAADAERRLLLAFPTLRGGREILDTAAGGLRGDAHSARCRNLRSSGICSMLTPSPTESISTSARCATGTTTRARRSRCSALTPDSRSASGGRYDTLLSRFGTARPATGFVLHVDRCHDSIVRRAGAIDAAVAVQVSWERDAHANALALARRASRPRGIACACDLTRRWRRRPLSSASSGARWTHRGQVEHGHCRSSGDRVCGAHRMNGLRVALPGGTLFESACTLLQDAGVARLDPARFDRELSIREGDDVYVKVRPTDVPVYVEMGACECGIVGKDVLWESSRECYELADLGFGRCRLVLAAPRDSALANGIWPQALRVATKYPVSARRFFAARSLDVVLIRLHGSVELAPLTGLADCVLDITATGRTLVANNLVEIAEAGASTARLIANHAALKTRNDAVGAHRRCSASRSSRSADGGRRMTIALARLDPAAFRTVIVERQRDGFSASDVDPATACASRAASSTARSMSAKPSARSSATSGSAAMRRFASGRTGSTASMSIRVYVAPDDMAAAWDGLAQRSAMRCVPRPRASANFTWHRWTCSTGASPARGCIPCRSGASAATCPAGARHIRAPCSCR